MLPASGTSLFFNYCFYPLSGKDLERCCSYCGSIAEYIFLSWSYSSSLFLALRSFWTDAFMCVHTISMGLRPGELTGHSSLQMLRSSRCKTVRMVPKYHGLQIGVHHTRLKRFIQLGLGSELHLHLYLSVSYPQQWSSASEKSNEWSLRCELIKNLCESNAFVLVVTMSSIVPNVRTKLGLDHGKCWNCRSCWSLIEKTTIPIGPDEEWCHRLQYKP